MASPFKSKAQLERCKRLVLEGKMKQETFEESLALTDVEALPDRLHPKAEDKKTEPVSGEGESNA